jgi:Arc/MetJ-type ribon-helix-helix transcriptional regulator
MAKQTTVRLPDELAEEAKRLIERDKKLLERLAR